MKKTLLKLITPLAIINSILIGLVAFLTVIMFRNNVTEFASILSSVIPFLTLGSILTKLLKNNQKIIITSAIFDFLIILCLYNPADCSSIIEFLKNLIDHNALILIGTYIYLIFYYILMLKRKAHNTI